VSKRAVIPTIYEYKMAGLAVHPNVECLNNWQVHPLSASLFSTCTVEIKFFPPFQPNDYLFRKFSGKGKEDWEVYAWAVRDFMVKNSHLELWD
jgi:hypothetical protein